MFMVVTELMILHMTRPKGQRKSSAVSTAQKGKVRTNCRSVIASPITKQFMDDCFCLWREWSRYRASEFPTNPRAQTIEYTHAIITRTTKLELSPCNSTIDSLVRSCSQQCRDRLLVELPLPLPELFSSCSICCSHGSGASVWTPVSFSDMATLFFYHVLKIREAANMVKKVFNCSIYRISLRL